MGSLQYSNRQTAGYQNSAGFTLIEVLISIFFFTVIITTLFGAFNSVFSTVRSIDEGIWAYDMAKICLNRMISDLESIHVTLEYTPPDFNEEADDFRIEGETTDVDGSSFSKLRFTSFAHLDFGQTNKEGIAEIVYYVTSTQDRGFVLRRADNLPPFSEFEEKTADPILCENVKSLTLTYFDENGDKQEDWDSESSEVEYATPNAIGIKLEIGDEGDEGDESGSFLFETMVTIPVFREAIEDVL
jgi:general secretion pathway protein J